MTAEVLDPPAELTAEAKARWIAVAPALAERGPVDTATLAAYCQAWARWRQAEAGLGKSSMLVKGKGGSVVPSPLLAISKDAASQCHALEKRLGLDEPAGAPGGEMSLRAFARLVGVDDKAIRHGIGTGRIPDSVLGRNGRGQPVIADVAAAREAWSANVSRPAKGEADTSLFEAQKRVAEERHRSIKFENDRKQGHFVSVAQASRERFESFRIVREGLFNLPARLSAELAAESDPAKVYARLDDEIRSALGAVAEQLEALAKTMERTAS